VQHGYDLQHLWELAVDNQIRTGRPESHFAVGQVLAGVPDPGSPGKLLKSIEEIIF
jgi:hypothetical protein